MTRTDIGYLTGLAAMIVVVALALGLFLPGCTAQQLGENVKRSRQIFHAACVAEGFVPTSSVAWGQ